MYGQFDHETLPPVFVFIIYQNKFYIIIASIHKLYSECIQSVKANVNFDLLYHAIYSYSS